MTHPHDFALLNDLLDGRMGWSATEELRRRLVEEPELGSAYDELVRLRAGLQALPRRAPPPDFLARVRARSGLAPAVEAAPASAPTADSAVAGSAPTSSREAPAGGGRVLRFPRRFLPLTAAAGLLVGLGAFALWGLRDRDRMLTSAPAQSAEGQRSPTTSPAEATGYAAGRAAGKKVGAPGKPGASAPPEAKGPEAGGTFPKPEALDAGLAEGARPHYGAPGGAVVPGLRAPTDDPAGAAPPRPASGPAGTEMAPARDGSSRAGVGGGGGGVARTGEADADAAPGEKAEHAPPAGGGAGGKLRAPESGWAWARPGADEILVVRAADLDGARADVALLLAAVRSGSSVEGRWKAAALPAGDLLRESSEPAQPALDDDAAKEDRPTGRGASAPMPRGASAPEPEDAKRKAPSAAPPLGTFVVEVTEDEWTRLAGALGSVKDAPGVTDPADAAAPPAPAAPLTPATRPAPAAPPVAVPPAGPPPPAPAPPPAPPPEPAPLPDLPIPPPAAGAAPGAEAEAPAPSETGGLPRTEDAGKGADKAPPADRRSEPRRRVRIVVLPR